MKITLSSCVSLLALSILSLADSVPWERIDRNNSVLLILDLQVGLYQIARDFDHALYHNNMMAHAALGNLFNIPTIMTTSAQTGPNGPLPKEILDMYPDAPLIMRQGEVDAWDNADFRAALEATGKKQVIVAGITTDVCTAFLALSLRAAGYSVFANVEASGTTTPLIRDVSNSRMQQAGVQLVTLFSIVIPWLDKYYPAYGQLARGHGAAVLNGTIIPGQQGLLTPA
ncbi:MAG: hypothetical protein Q9227_008218 [Pyrenula ochraceoflavens]